MLYYYGPDADNVLIWSSSSLLHAKSCASTKYVLANFGMHVSCVRLCAQNQNPMLPDPPAEVDYLMNIQLILLNKQSP